jgi:hypothetical protein
MATCVETFSCLPSGVMEVWRLYEYQYGIPVSVVLGLLVGMIVLAIYVRTRSIVHLAVGGLYTIAAFSSMWAYNSFFEEQVKMAIYVIAVSVASAITLLVLKLVKE